MILRGQLVTLRPLTVADAELTWAWRQSERAKFLNKGAPTVEAQRAWIAAHTTAGELNCIIEYQAAPVGTIALHDINPQHRSAILGRLLIGDAERVGQAPAAFEAELLLGDYAFATLGLHKLYGYVLEEHIGMVRLRAYLGYHQDGVLRDHFRSGDRYQNMIAVSLLENEYWTVCRPKLVSLVELHTRVAYQPALASQPAPEASHES